MPAIPAGPIKPGTTETLDPKATLKLAKWQQNATRSALFIVGFGFATWAALIPFAKMRTALDEGGLGLLLISLGVGAMAVMPFTGSVVARFGCRSVLRLGAISLCAILPLLAWLDSTLALRLCLFCFGGALGAMEVAANMQAVHVQREAGRSLMSSFHAFYSIGSITGAGLMTLFLWLGLKPLFAALACTIVIIAMAFIFDKGMLPQVKSKTKKKTPHLALPRGIVLLIGLLLLIAYMAEGSVANWGALLLTNYKNFEPEYSALGITVFSITIAAGRLTGDSMAQKIGSSAKIIAFGCVSSAVSYALIIYILPGFYALIGYALLGFCMANLAPTLFTLTGKQKVMPVELAIASVTAVGYASALISSPSIGLVARHTSLPTSLGLLSIILVLAAGGAYFFTNKKMQ